MNNNDERDLELKIQILKQMVSDLESGNYRYEKLRKLNPRGYSELWNRALTGDKRFDELVDEL